MPSTIQSPTVEHKFLTHASPEAVYQYLEQRARLSIPLSLTVTLRALHERKDPVINLALASFSADAEVLNEVFVDGDAADLIAICGNPNLPGLRWISEEDLERLLEEGPDEPLRTLFRNPSQAPDELCKALEREGVYSQISDSAWFRVVGFVLWHPYLTKPAPEAPYLSDYWGGPGNEDRPFQAVWRLLLTLPTEEVHAKSLEEALYRLGEFGLPYGSMHGVPGEKPKGRNFLEKVLRRWTVTDGRDEESAFFYLRKVISRLAAEHGIDKEFLLEHEDAAVRRGFYEVGSPADLDEFKQWLGRDGRNFIWGFVSNREAYQSGSDVKRAFGELFQNKKALKRYLKPDEIETAEYMRLAKQHAWFEKTEAEAVSATSEEIDLDEGRGYGQRERIEYTNIEGLANKVEKLAKIAGTAEDATQPLSEAISTLSLMAKYTNENLLEVSRDLVQRTANVSRHLDDFKRGLELFLEIVSKIAIWIGGGIALAWLARVLWRALIN